MESGVREEKKFNTNDNMKINMKINRKVQKGRMLKDEIG